MKISQSHLKTVIREEVELRLIESLVDYYIDIELQRGNYALNEQSYADYKKAARKAAMKRLAALGIAGAALGGVGGYGKTKADQHTASIRDRIEARTQAYEDYKSTPQYALEEVGEMLKRPSNYSWSWKTESGSMQSGDKERKKGSIKQLDNFPLLLDKNYGQVGVLSPEYGVARKVYSDLKKQLDAGSENLIPGVSEVYEPSGTADQWKRKFMVDHNLPEVPNYRNPEAGIVKKAFASGMVSDVGVSPHYDGVLYLPYDKIPKDMMMPNSLMSPSQYYMKIWNQFLKNQ
jgi:hypothetical protein